MCQIILKPQGLKVPVDRMRTVFRMNSDGWGIMAFNPDSTLTVVKKPIKTWNQGGVDATFEEFVKAYEQFEDRTIGIHFRNRTHGEIDDENTHPYPVLLRSQGHPIDLYLMHNGVIHGMGTPGKDKSDTYEYIEKFLRPMFVKYPGAWRDPQFMELVEDHVGSSNKLLLFGDDGTIMTVNEKAGDSEGGVWYSNQQGKFHNYSGYTETGKWHGGWHEGYDDRFDEWRGRGGVSNGNAPFSASRPSSASSVSTPESNTASKVDPKELEQALRNVAASATDATIREVYLNGTYDPRIGGNDLPIEALRYLTEADIEEVVENNPEAVAELLFTLGESFEWGEHDDEFRQKVLSS